jgi:hypothetical protein
MPAASALRLGELVATFALAQDNAFGQPLESQLRSCLLATWMAEKAGYDAELKEVIYWVALLRYLGCTGHAHEVAAYLGDEIAARARTLVHDSANPAEVARDVIALAGAARPDQDSEQVASGVMATIHEWAVSNFAAGPPRRAQFRRTLLSRSVRRPAVPATSGYSAPTTAAASP